MLTSQQIEKIRQKLEQSQNPLFFFDNDVDGLCSFLILNRSIDNRGKGFPVKSFPDLNTSYIRKIEELNPDAIFILDKPLVSEEFLEKVTKEKNLQITWIDHHNIDNQELKEKINENEKVSYYNTYPSAEPTTYIAQRIFNKQENLWLAMIGCIGDVYLPDFTEEFSENNPEILPKSKIKNKENNSENKAFNILHSTQLGKIIRMLNFGLMDTTTNVIQMMKFLMKAKNIQDILEENYKTKSFHKRYNELNTFLEKQLQKANTQQETNIETNLIFFTYSGEISMSSEIANNLFFKNPDKTIIVAYKRPEKINLSIRGKNALKLTKKALENIDGATGGGHEQACGAMLPPDSLEKFKENVERLLNQSQ